MKEALKISVKSTSVHGKVTTKQQLRNFWKELSNLKFQEPWKLYKLRFQILKLKHLCKWSVREPGKDFTHFIYEFRMILLKFFIKITFSLIQLTLFLFINTWKVDSARCSPCPNILGELPVGIHFNSVNETMGAVFTISYNFYHAHTGFWAISS